MASKFNPKAVMLYTLYAVSPRGENTEADFLPNEQQTAEQVGQDMANLGYRSVRLAAISVSNRRKVGKQHQLEIIQRFERTAKLIGKPRRLAA